MALSNAERQKRWIEKNRALHNLRRRKKNLNRPDGSQEVSAPATQLSKVDELRQLMKKASTEPPVAKPSVYRDDYGRIISETQWNALQKRKQQAANGGYVMDEYTQ